MWNGILIPENATNIVVYDDSTISWTEDTPVTEWVEPDELGICIVLPGPGNPNPQPGPDCPVYDPDVYRQPAAEGDPDVDLDGWVDGTGGRPIFDVPGITYGSIRARDHAQGEPSWTRTPQP